MRETLDFPNKDFIRKKSEIPRRLFAFLGNTIRSGGSKQPVSRDSWNLAPLTPEYLPLEHGPYVDALEAALSDGRILNIALSGNYGVGKSSILQELARRHDGRVVELSFSTLAPVDVLDLDDSVPKQATTPTNRIQQEIVKQLLYREEPGRTPGSRFERIERFRLLREIALSGVVGFAVALVFLLTTWSNQIVSVFTPVIDFGLWIHLIIMLLAVAIVLAVRRLSYGKIHVKQFTAGSATVTLDEKSVSYFDQYLDEIVHFFEVSKKQNIVIFEDIDRFNEAHIFETLRSLNGLLNAAPQIRSKIRFIYAIKDSIFDRALLQEQGRKLEQDMLGTRNAADAEIVRANRTKFFDLVIPVVPFITHRSARNLIAQLLGEIDHKIDSCLLDLAAQYVPDMRLLKNVRNEFIVFRDRIFAGHGAELNLSQTDLFAMMLYKSTHMAEFEAIRLGTSKIDILYQLGRTVVTSRIKEDEMDRRMLLRRVAQLNGAETRSAHLGKKLLDHMSRTAQAASIREENVSFTFRGAIQTPEDLTSPGFWRKFSSIDSGEAVILWNATYSENKAYYAATSHPLVFTREHLIAALGDSLDSERWDESLREDLNEQIAELSERVKFFRSADLGDLVMRSDAVLRHEGKDASFDEIARQLLTDGLAYQLVRAGYINRNFTLYTSTFHGDRVSTAATNFIIHHVERDVMDAYFPLTAGDVDAIVRERGREALKETALYNIAVLDHLLEADVDAADIMVRSLVTLGESQRRFLDAYLASGARRRKFAARLVQYTPRAFEYLIGHSDLDDESLYDLVDEALANLPKGAKYHSDEKVAAFLSENSASLSVMTSPETSRVQAESIAVLFGTAGVCLPLLTPLSEIMQHEFIDRSFYEISYENLRAAMGVSSSLALDSIAAANAKVYSHCLANLAAYLKAVAGVCPTVESPDRFGSIVEAVAYQADGVYLGEVIERAAKGCVVNDLDEVPAVAWVSLAKASRFPTSFHNTALYIASVGSIDEHLAMMLSRVGVISNAEEAGEDAKQALAITILSSSSVLSPELRAFLLTSLRLEDYLDVAEIPVEPGNLFATLRKLDLIADDVTSYDRIIGTDWPTREAFIHESPKFMDYVTPTQMRNDLEALFMSENVATSIKAAIVERSEDFTEGIGKGGLTHLARFAIANDQHVKEDVLSMMASLGVPAEYVVTLIEPHLLSIGLERLLSILKALGGEYLKLTAVGHDKPKLPNTAANRALLDCLKSHGIVNTYDPSCSPIRVNKKYK
ncbi:MAG: DNA-binding protein [Arthrobacter sp.]